MDKLIQALQIFLKYANEDSPTHCEHDVMMIAGIPEDALSEEDKAKVDELGFHWSTEYDCYISYRFGSA